MRFRGDRLRTRASETLTGWCFVLPALVHLLAFSLVPIAVAFGVSLNKWSLLRPDRIDFVGLGNYTAAVREPAFWNALGNSAKFALLSVPTGIAVALAVALLVNRPLRGIAVFRTLYYIPAISSGVAISMIWIWIYLPDTGLLNTMLLGLLGEHGLLAGLLRALHIAPLTSIDFLNRTGWALAALAFMSIWTGLGPRMVLYLAALLNIPQPLYEAAQLDGASKVDSFVHVTWPSLAPTTLFVLITSTIGALQVFTPVYMMTKGGPNDSTDVIGYHIYTESWVNFHTGLAAAKSFLLLAVIVAISVAQIQMMRRQLAGYGAG